MLISEVLEEPQTRATLETLAQAHGISPAQVDAVLGKVVPVLATSMERLSLSRGGLADVVHEVTNPQHAAVLTDPAHALSPTAVQSGAGALTTILGSNEKARSLAAQAAYSSGVGQTIVEKLLPILASMVMAAIAKQTQGGLGDVIRKLPGGQGPAGRAQRSPQSDAGSEADQDAAQDADDDSTDNQNDAPAPRQSSQASGRGQSGGFGGDLGDVLSKIPGMPGSLPGGVAGGARAPSTPSQSGPAAGGDPFGGQAPLPLPGDRIPGVNAPARTPSNPYGNLPEIIRDGGRTSDGSSLGPQIRDVLGKTLGFQSKGIMGWIIQLIVLRWGWSLVRRVLGRVV